MFNPYSPAKPCLHCEHWGGWTAGGSHVKCVRDRVQIQANPDQGCVFWVRAVGADDESQTGRAIRRCNPAEFLDLDD